MKGSAKPTGVPVDLDAYRSLIRLDEPLRRPDPETGDQVERVVLATELVRYLLSERRPEYHGIVGETGAFSDGDARRALRALLTVRRPGQLPSWFHERLDLLLQSEAGERSLTDAKGLQRVAQMFRMSSYGAADRCVLWQGDITTLHVDAIVNASNAFLLGCFQPFHGCIDNVIHCAAGPWVREDCHAIMTLQGHAEGTGWAKVTRGYNLPAKFILHTVGPIVGGWQVGISREQEHELSACYRSCLDLADRVPAIRSVAFCSISTGVFGFPQEPAAAIAVRTVDQWLAEHPAALDLVVFNVFCSNDLEIYGRVLK